MLRDNGQTLHLLTAPIKQVKRFRGGGGAMVERQNILSNILNVKSYKTAYITAGTSGALR